jgi:serine/threonine protein kinase
VKPLLLLRELRRRGVLGAVALYGAVAAGGLQVADIVVHSLELPAWTLRALIWLGVLGLPITAVISWFYDLTRRGFVRTQAPPGSPRAPSPPPTAEVLHALESLKPGSLLAGRYRIEKELGKGGMGRVFAALDTKLGRRVAVKIVTAAAQDPARLRRFEQEARSAGALEHSNVLAVYDLGEQDGVPFLVTELLEGHTLRTVISNGALTPPEVQSIAQQLARGLAAAHARGVVHRDLKPENLFLTEDGRLKILDFGLARLSSPDEEPREHLTVTGAIFGTPGYLSPEQARGERAGPPSDVFSAGAIVYEMLAQRRAFPGDSLIEAGHLALTARPTPLPDTVPAGLAAVVDRCLEKDPRRRFASGAELARALETSQVPQATVTPALPVRSWRRSTALGVAVAALALGAAVASAVRVGRQERSRAHGDSELAQPAPAPPPRALPAPAPGSTETLPPPPTPPPPAKRDRVVRKTLPPPDPGLRAIPKTPYFDAQMFARDMMQAETAGNSGIISGARMVERMEHPEKAEKMLRSWLQSHPADSRVLLELVALLRRSGRDANAELRKHPNMPADWPTPLLRVFAGQMSDTAVLETASAARDAGERASRLCEAHYYLGLLHATGTSPDHALAAKHYREAMHGDCGESDLAGEALMHLGGSE